MNKPYATANEKMQQQNPKHYIERHEHELKMEQVCLTRTFQQQSCLLNIKKKKNWTLKK